MIHPPINRYIFVHGCCVFFSFFAFVPMSVNMRNFDGHCILFSKANWTNQTNMSLDKVNWGNSSNCNFVIFMGIASFLLSLFFITRCFWFIYKECDGTPFYYFTSMIGSAIIVLTLAISGMILAAGFSHWCDSFLFYHKDAKCHEAKVLNAKETLEYSTAITVCQFGTWCIFFLWLFGFLLYFVKVRYFHKNQDLIESLAKEKDTLISHRHRYQRIGEERTTA